MTSREEQEIARRVIVSFLNEAIRKIDDIEREILPHADWPNEVDIALVEARDRLKNALGWSRA